MNKAGDSYDIEMGADELSGCLQQGGRLLISFGATWCGPCKQMLPALKQIALALEGQIRVGRIECDLHPEPGRTHRIQAYPTLVFFDQGKELGRVTGLQSVGQLKAWIEKLQPAAGPLEALALATPDWGAFYGNRVLQQSLVEVLCRLAKEGKLILSRFPSWDGERGSISAALVGSDRPEIFERMTGMPCSFASVLELASLSDAQDITRVFDALEPGMDVSRVWLQMIADWLTDDAEEWSACLTDPGLDALRASWSGLVRQWLAGEAVPAAAWEAIREAASTVGKVRREHDLGWRLACLFGAICPPPALDAPAALIMPVQAQIRGASYLLHMLRAGATEEVLKTPNAVNAWFERHWTLEVWQTLSVEQTRAEHQRMREDPELKPRLARQKIVEDAAAVIREAARRKSLDRLVDRIRACPLVVSAR